MIKAGIIGSTGYAGGELICILTGHKGRSNGTVSEVISIKIMQMYTSQSFQIVDAKCMDDKYGRAGRSGGCGIFTATLQGCAHL